MAIDVALTLIINNNLVLYSIKCKGIFQIVCMVTSNQYLHVAFVFKLLNYKLGNHPIK